MGVPIPDDASDVHAFSRSVLQGRTSLLRFSLPPTSVPAFLEALCPEALNDDSAGVSVQDFMTMPDPDGVNLPLWWTPKNAKAYDTDTCNTPGGSGARWLVDKTSAEQYLVYLLLFR